MSYNTFSLPASTTGSTTQFVGQVVEVASADGLVGFLGASPTGVQSVTGAAVTGGDAITLVNNLRTALINFGLVE